MFSMNDDFVFVVCVVEFGVQGYVFKGDDFWILLKVVCKVIVGDNFILLQFVEVVMFFGVVIKVNLVLQMMLWELEIFCLFGCGDKIVEVVEVFGIFYKMVVNMILLFKQKLGVKNYFDLIRIVVEIGMN